MIVCKRWGGCHSALRTFVREPKMEVVNFHLPQADSPPDGTYEWHRFCTGERQRCYRPGGCYHVSPSETENTMPDDLHTLTIAEAARRIEGRELSPVELIEAILARIEGVNPQIDAFITLMAEQALEEARAAESEIAGGRWRGPMHGIPYGLKDIYDAAGVPTTGHSRTAMDNIAGSDATATARLRAAGGVLMGKLSTHEFAHGGPSFDLPWPPARNPWNREHFSGGSSSGSGAAVAAGFVFGAMGSDTGGSIRGPAALCGIVGLKPTYGLVSRAGVIPNSFTFDHCGPMTWTVEDCAIMLQAVAGHDPRDPASAAVDVPDYRAALTGDARGLRVGVLRHFWEEDLTVHPETVAAMEAAVETLRSLGCRVETARIRPVQDWYDVKIIIAESELFSVHYKNLIERPGDFGADFLGRSLAACLFGAPDYVQAQRLRRRMLAEMEEIYARYDILVAPSATGPAPRLDAHRTVNFWKSPSITTPFNVTGGPSLTQCIGFSESGLPLAWQVTGRPFDETTVLRFADAYEKATPWRERRPELRAGPRPDEKLPEYPPPAPDLDPQTAALVAGMAKRAGLRLDAHQLAILQECAPHVFAMAERVRGEYAWTDEPANTFWFPGR